MTPVAGGSSSVAYAVSPPPPALVHTARACVVSMVTKSREAQTELAYLYCKNTGCASHTKYTMVSGAPHLSGAPGPCASSVYILPGPLLSFVGPGNEASQVHAYAALHDPISSQLEIVVAPPIS